MARPKTATRRPLSADEIRMGEEPRILRITSQNALISALNWYNYFNDNEKAKEYALARYPELKDVPAGELRTLGSLARMLSRGTDLGEFADRPQKIVDNLLARFTKPQPVETADDGNEERATVRRAVRRREALIAELESEVDSNMRNPRYKFDAYKWMVSKEVNAITAKAIAAYYDAWENKSAFIHGIIRACDQISANATVVRRSRKKKPVSAAKAASKVQFKQSDTGLRLQSIAPADIVGANELWVYNTAKRTLAVYRGEKLTVKGTTIQDYDEGKSFVKKLRKPEKDIEFFRAGSRASFEKVFNKLTTKAAPVATGRLNSDTILIKAFK